MPDLETIIAFLRSASSVSVTAFAVSSMLSVGLSYSLGQLVASLRDLELDERNEERSA